MPMINKTTNAHLGIDFFVFSAHIDKTVIKPNTIIPKISKNSGLINDDILDYPSDNFFSFL